MKQKQVQKLLDNLSKHGQSAPLALQKDLKAAQHVIRDLEYLYLHIGHLSNMCTYNYTSKVCNGCQCKRKLNGKP